MFRKLYMARFTRTGQTLLSTGEENYSQDWKDDEKLFLSAEETEILSDFFDLTKDKVSLTSECSIEDGKLLFGDKNSGFAIYEKQKE